MLNLKKKVFLISRSFSPWSLSVKHGCGPQQTICIDGSWLEEHKSGFKFYAGYSMMKIWHLGVTYLFLSKFQFLINHNDFRLAPTTKIKPSLDFVKKELSKMYTFTMVGCTLFKLCHCKCTKATYGAWPSIKQATTIFFLYFVCLRLYWDVGGGSIFTKIIRGCACRTSKIWLSLYQFYLISHPSVYHFGKKSTQFWPNWVLFTIMCPKYTQFI